METLPSEVMTIILDFLPFTVRRNMAIMSKTLYYASLHPILLRKELLVYNEVDSNIIDHTEESTHTFENFMNVLTNTERNFLQLKLQKSYVDHDNYLNLFEICGYRLTSLHLNVMSWFTDEYLDAINHYCKNLEKLKFYNINQFSINKPCRPIPKLCRITFDSIKNMSDKEFNLIILCAPNLKHLHFKNCQILSWPRVIKRYYPDDSSTLYNSDDVFTDVNIINYLKTAKSITSLKLQNLYHIFYKLPEHIKLNSLFVSLSINILHNYIDDDIFLLKLGKHTSLRKLQIDCIPCCFLPAVSKLCNLNSLTLSYTTQVKSSCFDKAACLQKFCDSLENLKKLKILHLSQCLENRVSENQLTHMIPEYTLSFLTLLDSTIDSAYRIINLGQNLIDLRIKNGQILQSSDYFILFKKLAHLRCLSIEDCVGLSDDILLNSSISNIRGLNTLNLRNSKLSHWSLRHIKLFHLEDLIITNLSLGSCLATRNVLEFEESMKQLSYSAPVLTSLHLAIPWAEEVSLRCDVNLKLLESLSNSSSYQNYFNHLKNFKLLV